MTFALKYAEGTLKMYCNHFTLNYDLSIVLNLFHVF